MDCLQPPLEEAPTGKWHCPMCPPLPLPAFFQPQLPPELQAEPHPEIHSNTDQGSPSNFQPIRASSVASTSYSHEPQTRAASSRKGKGKAIFTDESEIESPLTRRQRRAMKESRGRGRTSETEEEEPEIDSTPRAVKRMKLKLGTRPPPQSRVVVRLKLPPKSKGKEREEEESPRKDVFEDLLSAEDRDTSKTLIDTSDKARYEKSRTQAEVNSLLRPRWNYIQLAVTDKIIPTTTRPRNTIIYTIKTPPPLNARPAPCTNPTTHATIPRLPFTIHPEPQFTITLPLSARCFIFNYTDVANTNHSIWRIRYPDLVRCPVSRGVRQSARWKAVDMRVLFKVHEEPVHLRSTPGMWHLRSLTPQPNPDDVVDKMQDATSPWRRDLSGWRGFGVRGRRSTEQSTPTLSPITSPAPNHVNRSTVRICVYSPKCFLTTNPSSTTLNPSSSM